MIKRFIFVCLFLCIIILTACGKVRSGKSLDHDSHMADARVEQIIEAINDRDEETLKTMFSAEALAEIDNLSMQIDALYNLFSEKIIFWEKHAGNVSESSDYGAKTKIFRYEYKAQTEQAEFMLFIYEITENTNTPSAVGVYMIQIYTPEIRDEVFDWGNAKKHAGISISY